MSTTSAPNAQQKQTAVSVTAQEPKGEKILHIRFAAGAADGLPLSGPNGAERTVAFRANDTVNGWEIWFQVSAQRFLLERYEGKTLVKRCAIPHSGVSIYEIAL